MTEAGEKWVEANRRPVTTGIHVQVEQADHWLRAFCDEVERRAQEYVGFINRPLHDRAMIRGFCYDDLKRELLEGDDGCGE